MVGISAKLEWFSLVRHPTLKKFTFVQSPLSRNGKNSFKNSRIRIMIRITKYLIICC